MLNKTKKTCVIVHYKEETRTCSVAILRQHLLIS
jgi:hypothetical protein